MWESGTAAFSPLHSRDEIDDFLLRTNRSAEDIRWCAWISARSGYRHGLELDGWTPLAGYYRYP